jgi:uncharacterized protein
VSTQRPAKLGRVLVDSSGYYALVDRYERETHPIALAIRERVIREQARLFTTNFVVAETHALLLVRLGRAIAARFLLEIDRSTTTIVRVSATDERRARAVIIKYQDKAFSLTDATSFAVMERLRIGWAFNFDRNFAQYGIPLLTPASQ